MSACCITPAHSLVHASRFTLHELVAESGVAPDDLLVMSQPSLVPAPSPHQEHAVRFELTMTGFADRRLNQLGYACHKVLELRAGIEPALPPWQGDVIPLDQRSPLKRQGEGETRRRGENCQCHYVPASPRLPVPASLFSGAGGRSRTFTKLGLSQLPLPVGLRQHDPEVLGGEF